MTSTLNQPPATEEQSSTKLTNPYPWNPDTVERLNLVVSKEDFAFIRSSMPGRNGTQQAVLGTMYKKLCNELRKRNITSYSDADRFIECLNQLNFDPPCKCGGATPGPAPGTSKKANGRHERGGTPRVR